MKRGIAGSQVTLYGELVANMAACLVMYVCEIITSVLCHYCTVYHAGNMPACLVMYLNALLLCSVIIAVASLGGIDHSSIQVFKKLFLYCER